MCPTCPWLAPIGQPEAGLRDAFGAASRRDLTAKSRTPILVVRVQVAERRQSSQLNTAPISLRRGLRGGRACAGSGETELDALPGPVTFKLTLAEQGLCGEPGRLAAVQDGLRDLRA